RVGGAEERLSPASLAPHEEAEPARRLFHSEEHGTGLNLPILRSQVSYYRPPLPYPRPAAQPLHSLLLLPPRSGAGTDGHAGRHEPAALLRRPPSRVLSQFHLQAPLSHPPPLRAQL